MNCLLCYTVDAVENMGLLGTLWIHLWVQLCWPIGSTSMYSCQEAGCQLRASSETENSYISTTLHCSLIEFDEVKLIHQTRVCYITRYNKSWARNLSAAEEIWQLKLLYIQSWNYRALSHNLTYVMKRVIVTSVSYFLILKFRALDRHVLVQS